MSDVIALTLSAGFLLDLLLGDPAWLRRLVLRGSGSVTVLEPPALAAEVRQVARMALQEYPSG